MSNFNAAQAAAVLFADPERGLTLSHRQCRRVTKRVRKLGVKMTSDFYYYFVA